MAPSGSRHALHAVARANSGGAAKNAGSPGAGSSRKRSARACGCPSGEDGREPPSDKSYLPRRIKLNPVFVVFSMIAAVILVIIVRPNSFSDVAFVVVASLAVGAAITAVGSWPWGGH
jgi:hypothetical protein